MLKQYLTLIDPLYNWNLESDTTQLYTYPKDISFDHQQIDNVSFSNMVTPDRFVILPPASCWSWDLTTYVICFHICKSWQLTIMLNCWFQPTLWVKNDKNSIIYTEQENDLAWGKLLRTKWSASSSYCLTSPCGIYFPIMNGKSLRTHHSWEAVCRISTAPFSINIAAGLFFASILLKKEVRIPYMHDCEVDGEP